MKPSRTILIYWFLLIVPTLVVGAWALKLLSHEKERLEIQAMASLSDRAKAMAENLELTVAEVEDALTRSLVAIDDKNLRNTLRMWEETNPLVRNVFVWRKGMLDYPTAGLESTAEERRFITRYEALFTGRMDFGFADSVSQGEWSRPAGQNSPGKEIRGRSSARKDLLSLARLETSLPQKGQEIEGQGPRFRTRSGWIPWFSENRLFILGWVQKEEKGPVYGLELELMALLSRLIVQLPPFKESDVACGLVSGDGDLVYQSGGFPIDVKKKPAISAPLSGLLPHYRINLYFSEKGISQDRRFIYVPAMLILIFSAAMIAGGALLIKDSRRNMKDAMEKTSFVSSVSHELKTPLTSIRMYAELLSEGRVNSPAKVSHYLSVIVAESQRLTRLVNNVLDFGRLEQGKKTYHRAPLDIAAFIKGILDAHSIRITGAGLVLDLDIPDESLMVMTDRDALEQVLLNLIDNAVKYAAQGRYLGFSVKELSEDDVELTVRDRGPGIPKAHQELIFDKFHRVDNSLTAEQAGSGLGLSIARRILRDLGGDLWFESGHQGGSCFKARIKK